MSKPLFLILHFTPFLIHNIAVKDRYPVLERILDQFSQPTVPKLTFLINFKHVSLLTKLFANLSVFQFTNWFICQVLFLNLLICQFVNCLPLSQYLPSCIHIFILVIAVEKMQILSSTQYLRVLFWRAGYWHVVFLKPHAVWICKIFRQDILIFTLYEVTKVPHPRNYQIYGFYIFTFHNMIYFSQCIIRFYRNWTESMNWHDCSYKTEYQVARKSEFSLKDPLRPLGAVTIAWISKQKEKAYRRSRIVPWQHTSLVLQIPRYHFLLFKDQHSHLPTPKNVILSCSVIVALSS